MKVLIACEESQAVCIEFRKLGHGAYSCDIQECSGGHPEWHIQDDCLSELRKDYDLRLSFPPCTDISVSGAKHFHYKRENGQQQKSITFFLNVWRQSHCVENPIGILNTPKYLKKWFPKLYDYALFIGFPFKPTQIVHPYMFGDLQQKATCLWLNNLPDLNETNNVKELMMALPYKERCAIHSAPPSKDRAKLRSKTFPGIARAMASQWGR